MKRARLPGIFRPPAEPLASVTRLRERKNAYECDTCGGFIVTIDRDEGVTPMFLACRVKGDPTAEANDCGGRMASKMYPPEPWPIDATPTWEWFRPSNRAIARMEPSMRDHVERGGLDLRKIEVVGG